MTVAKQLRFVAPIYEREIPKAVAARSAEKVASGMGMQARLRMRHGVECFSAATTPMSRITSITAAEVFEFVDVGTIL